MNTKEASMWVLIGGDDESWVICVRVCVEREKDREMVKGKNEMSNQITVREGERKELLITSIFAPKSAQPITPLGLHSLLFCFFITLLHITLCPFFTHLSSSSSTYMIHTRVYT